ncbi:MAG: flap endonuclease [Gammaproteobacteria bacterium]|nr:flap endonuclease [Gammaproteobacteria bacterium]
MSVASESDSVYLIDASIYIFQAHFSPYIECTDRDGNPLNAVYGFCQFLLQFLRRTQPPYVGVAHDQSLFSGFRHQLCPHYKSNREQPDANLEMQLKACFELCEVLGLSGYRSTTYEADDIIGTLAANIRTDESAGKAGCHAQIYIVSRDKDLAQLLGDSADCLWEFSKNRRRYEADIKSEFGVRPDQLCDYLGLAGDAVDCISGVPGIGPVKAKELLCRFGDLDSIYNNLQAVGEMPLRGAKSLAQSLAQHQNQAELSRTLATIICEVDDASEDFANAGLDDLQRTDIDLDELRSFLLTYRFQSQQSEQLVKQAQRLTERRRN